MESLEPQDQKAIKDPQESRGSLGLRVQLETSVQLARPDLKERPDQMVLLVLLVRQVRRVGKGHLVLPEPQGLKEPPALME